MIIPTMSPLEKTKEFESDFDKLRIKGLQSEKAAIKGLKKCYKFPALYLVNYKVMASGNDYILYYYARNKAELDRPCLDYFCKSRDKSGKPIFLKLSKNNDVPTMQEYTMHFVSRYNERYFGNKVESMEEVMCRYFIANYIGIPTRLNENIMKKYKHYGDLARFGMKVNKGFCLQRTFLEENVEKKQLLAIGITNVTFIDNKSLKEEQVIAMQKENFRYCKMLSEKNRPYIPR